MLNISILSFAVTLHISLVSTETIPDQEAGPWVVYEGQKGPGFGHHIVFVTGDDEYRSEEGMPMLAKILAFRHGFKCFGDFYFILLHYFTKSLPLLNCADRNCYPFVVPGTGVCSLND